MSEEYTTIFKNTLSFERSIRENRTPERLMISLWGSNEDEGITIGDALQGNCSVKHLVLRCHSLIKVQYLEKIYDYVRTSPYLESLDLLHSQKSPVELFQAVGENPNIRSLKCTLKCPEMFHACVAMLERTDSLVKLDVDATDIFAVDDDDLKLLASTIAVRNKSLRELVLRSTNTRNEIILQAIPADHNIEKIRFRKQPFTTALMSIFHRTQSIQFFQLDLCDQNEETSTRVIEGLARCKSIISLDLELDRSETTEKVQRLVCNLVQTNRKITNLTIRLENDSLNWYRLGESIIENGMITKLFLQNAHRDLVLTILCRCTWLKELTLFPSSENAMNFQVAEAVASHPTLEKLAITSVDRYFCKKLTIALSSTSKLRSLNLFNGGLNCQDGSVYEVANYLSSENCSLKKLEFDRYSIDDESMKVILSALKYNKTLESLVIRRYRRVSNGMQCECSVDALWTDVLMSSLEVNKCLWDLQIPSLKLEEDLNGILAYYCTRNRFRNMIPCLQTSLMPRLLTSLLNSPMGKSVLFFHLSKGQLVLNPLECSKKRIRVP